MHLDIFRNSEPRGTWSQRFARHAVLAVTLACSLVADSAAQTASPVFHQSTGEAIVLPPSIPDPFEPMNRMMWSFNQGVIRGVVKPSAVVYRFVVVKPVRTGIGNFGRNIAYPGRLVNNLIQGKWAGARNETDRFFLNTIVGGAGFVDVATRWKIAKSDADFGQTFGQWGWKPGCYLMLPIFGPSNERDTLGFAADTASNPLTYITPYTFNATDPLTYFSPYTYTSAGVTYNNLSDTADDYVRFNQTEKDAYSQLQYAWTFARASRQPDFKVQGPQDEASLQTLQTVYFTNQNHEFPNHGATRSVLIPATGKKLKFTYWLQPKTAPVVYIVPGLGSHRLSGTVLALAELVYQQGFSAVSLSSAYNYEFMENASTSALPAYTPVDAQDLHVALTDIDRQLAKLYPNRLGAKAVLGYSMGAFHSLFIAATASTNQTPLLQFDRYVAIDTPVRLLHGVSRLDEFYAAPLAWPAEERTDRLANTLLKVAALTRMSPSTNAPPPFEAVESKFLIGLTFRFILRDIIFSSQQRTNMGILEHRIEKLRRDPAYQEILQYSYHDYFEQFLIPYYQTRGIDLRTPAALTRAGDLKTYTDSLKANRNIRIIVNRNDILLADEDLKWLEDTFETDRLTIFPKGGHLGNLGYPDVQKAILGALDGLIPPL